MIKQSISLQPYNTFGLPAIAKQFISVNTEEALKAALTLNIEPTYVIGGGSNILLQNDIDGLVIHNQIKGISVMMEMEKHVLVEAYGGETWHDLVTWAVDNDYGGLENMALIPGSVGAAPIQNIGAYGVELKEVMVMLDAYEKRSGKKHVLWRDKCRFGYRDSIFKQLYKNRFVITKVVFKLYKAEFYQPNTSYGAIQSELEKKGILLPTIRDVYETVIAIRQSKLPNPTELPNAGSFFKNPVISIDLFKELKSKFPNIVSYPIDSQSIKIPAGWLIEHCGWKGKRIGEVGTYPKQALVIVNYGAESGQEIFSFSSQIIEAVQAKYGIVLEREVTVLP